MSRAALYFATALGTGLVVGLMAVVGAPTWALIAAAFGFSFLVWNHLESRGDQDTPDR